MSNDNFSGSSEQIRNFLDYVREEDRTFAELPFNELDSLVFAVLAYCRYDGYVPTLEQKGKWVPLSVLGEEPACAELTSRISSTERRRALLKSAAASRRFGEVKLNFYEDSFDEVLDKQFSAVTFLLPDHTLYMSYRGTDNTLTGWRENFNMAFLNKVPAQSEAAEYCERAFAQAGSSILPWKKIRGFRLGGHSKGGNLAVYAAMSIPAELRAQLTGAYSHDGPGFKQDVFSRPEYVEIKDRVHRFLPQDSMIGTLLIQNDSYNVVHSVSHGFGQHDPFSWELSGDGVGFADGGKLSEDSQRLNETLDRWMAGLSDSKRLLMVDVLFDLIGKSGAQSFGEVMDKIAKREWSALRGLRNVPSEQRMELVGMLIGLGRAYIETVRRRNAEADQ